MTVAVTPEERLAALLAPLELDEFFAHTYEQKPAVLRGSPARALGLLSLERLLERIASPEEIRGKIKIEVDRLRRDLKTTLESLRAYADEGQPILWDAARGVTPELDALTSDLALAMGANVCPNVYSTGSAGSPFGMHCDAHEVLALQLEGQKQWTISNVRADRPLDAPAYADDLRAELTSHTDEAARDVLMQPVLEPGDVLYIPRGVFHCARIPPGSSSPRSLHVTFGIQPLTGCDVLETLMQVALGDRSFRVFFPLAPQDRDGRLAEEQLALLERRLARLIESGALRSAVRALEEHGRRR